MVSFARRGEGSDRRMAATLQRGTSAFEPRLSRAERVRGSRNKASAPPCNGPGRYGIWGLRAPARCSTVPAGTNAASKGARLKLTVVRRTWAGHDASRVAVSSSLRFPFRCLKPMETSLGSSPLINRHTVRPVRYFLPRRVDIRFPSCSIQSRNQSPLARDALNASVNSAERALAYLRWDFHDTVEAILSLL